MKFNEFIRYLFDSITPKVETKPLQKGRPPNVMPNGSVLRHPGVVIKSNVRQHHTKEGKPCFQFVKGGKRQQLPVMVHRVVPASVFKARVNAAKRKAAGRYVW